MSNPMRERLRQIALKVSRLVKNPVLIPRIGRTVLAMYLTTKPVLRQAAIQIHYDCPCACRFCSAALIRKSDKRVMDIAELERLIRELSALGCLSVCFTGGEPLAHPEILRLVSCARKNGMMAQIITSCVTFSEKQWKDLKVAGVNTMYLSVDGIGEAHDRFRGVPGLFAKVEAAIEACRANDIEFYFNGVVTNENIADKSVYTIIDYCRKNDIGYIVLLTSASGKYAQPEHLLTGENREAFELIRRMPNVFWEGDTNLAAAGCPAGAQTIIVSAYGDLMPCPFIEISFGNVREMPLKRALEKMWSYDLFSHVTPRCLMGADRKFYDEWLAPLDRTTLPNPIQTHPMRDSTSWAGTKGIVR